MGHPNISSVKPITSLRFHFPQKSAHNRHNPEHILEKIIKIASIHSTPNRHNIANIDEHEQIGINRTDGNIIEQVHKLTKQIIHRELPIFNIERVWKTSIDI